MKLVFAALTALAVLGGSSALAEQIGSVDTTWRAFSANDKIVIEAFDDPRVPGVSCHLSRAQTGGISGSLGLAEDTSDGSIACRQTGPISVDMAELKDHDGESVFKESTSIWFKSMQVVRFVDINRNTIVYLVYSTKLIDGSPKNAITSVPVMPWH